MSEKNLTYIEVCRGPAEIRLVLPRMANVILLRSPSGDTPDRYEDSFKILGYNAFSVPVLETTLKNLDKLSNIVKRGPHAQNYDGVIVTSSRACEAWRRVLEDFISPGEDSANWSSTPFYAVGTATAAALAAINGSSHSSPKDIRGGSESGTSERLAKFILDDVSGDEKSVKFLYLVGDKNRDTMPNILETAGVALDSIQVYGTQGSSNFANDLKSVLSHAPSNAKQKWWIIFFAPSSAEFVLPALQECFNLSEKQPQSLNIAAIGPTTSTFLTEALHVHVDVTPSKPTSDDLSKAILTYDNNSLA